MAALSLTPDHHQRLAVANVFVMSSMVEPPRRSSRARRLTERLAVRAQLALGIRAVFSTLEAFDKRLEHLRATTEALDERLRTTTEALDERLRTTTEALDERLRTTTEALDERVRTASEAIDQATGASERMEERIGVVDGRLRAEATRVNALEVRLEEVRTDHLSLQREFPAIEQIVSAARLRPAMWGVALEPFVDEFAGNVYGFRGGTSAPPTERDVCRRMLDLFRAPPAVVQDRLRPYLELIGNRAPVVDIGCGRGDFLDLLRERNISYMGVDPDPGMLAAVRARGHSDIFQADANAYLESVPDRSLGAVFCAYLIEHLSASYLLRFIELSLAKLEPGGIFIAETPNPHSAHASKAFWADITRRGPVFPEVAVAICWTLGFGSAYVFHPHGSGDADADRFVEREFALVAKKTDEVDGETGLDERDQACAASDADVKE